MKPILVAAGLALAIGGTAQAQPAFNPAAITQLRADPRLANQPARASFDQGFVLDAGAASVLVSPGRSWRPASRDTRPSVAGAGLPSVTGLSVEVSLAVALLTEGFFLSIPLKSV